MDTFAKAAKDFESNPGLALEQVRAVYKMQKNNPELTDSRLFENEAALALLALDVVGKAGSSRLKLTEMDKKAIEYLNGLLKPSK